MLMYRGKEVAKGKGTESFRQAVKDHDVLAGDRVYIGGLFNTRFLSDPPYIANRMTKPVIEMNIRNRRWFAARGHG